MDGDRDRDKVDRFLKGVFLNDKAGEVQFHGRTID